MFSEFRIWGHPVHLVLEDANGAFEVDKAFTLHSDGRISVNADIVLEAIDERNRDPRPPLQRTVKFDA